MNDVNIPTNVGVCTVSLDVLHKLLRLPDEVDIILVRQDMKDYEDGIFRIAIKDEVFACMNVPLKSDGHRAQAPAVEPIYKANEDEQAKWAGWRQVPDDEDANSDVEDWCQWW